MIKKILHIVRHGQTDLNKQGIVQGRGMNTDLNAEGLLQADLFYNSYKDVKFDKIYISELKRTQQSIQQFIDLGIPYQKLSGLDELGWGEQEGQLSTPETKGAFLHIIRAWNAGELDVKFEGGESPNEIKARQIEAMETIMSHTEEKNVLICMHGRAMRFLLCWLTERPLSEAEQFPHQNLVLYKVAYDGEKFEIIDFNNSIHLNNH
ncbi:histidine phosphatase family protein [Mucilaginibacter myungsuensis]|uniref:Histidine phosphatase family protein n=1 Tax=Mucilaginibacter myungsuensis TaxID=649104 RepID=A0A929PUV6_9SPHI|nr:histidine phosphatase family protein [Mucilaginibacter myungsuensis]MBE9660351.1 histidine phosphatase family protein [Mucilaginibacter myungsuensis]MDN3600393.1 histidine phosphatase family protein [Mucilaginibacter myungsuensis]